MINILISTIDDRINGVVNVLLPPREDVQYIISHQYTDGKYKSVPEALNRNDVSFSQMHGRGLTKSRNNALNMADGEIGLIADDDVTYNDHYIDTLKKIFLGNPDIDIALFKIRTKDGEPAYKKYPDYEGQVKNLDFSVSSIEIGFNIPRVKESGIFFDERFGVGSDCIIGSEENIFIEDCLKAGLRVFVVPEYVVEHPYLSTSNSVPPFDKRKIWVTGALDCRRNGSVAILKAFGGTLKILPKLMRHHVNPLYYFYHRLSAVLYILRTNKYERRKRDS